MTMRAYDTRAACATQEKMRHCPLDVELFHLCVCGGGGIAKRLFFHVGKGKLFRNALPLEVLVNLRLCSLALVLFLAVHGSAAAQDFGTFSMDVPQGWIASVGEGGAVAVIAPKNEAAVTIAMEKLEGLSPEEGVRVFAKELGGSEPQKTADDEYAFHFTRNGVENRAFFRARKERFMLITVSDDTGKHQQTIDAMLRSLTEK